MKFNSYCIKSVNSVVHKVIFYNTINGIAQLSKPVREDERAVDTFLGSIDSFIEDHREMHGSVMKNGRSHRVGVN